MEYFTPTESAAVATVYSLIISLFVYKDCSFKDLYGIFRDSAVKFCGCHVCHRSFSAICVVYDT